jgi:Etoposide-induced protein 2.4 (EI24)
MSLLFDSLSRALGQCLHPRVLLMSVLPLLLMLVCTAVPALFFWADAQALVQGLIARWDWLASANTWLAGLGFSGLAAVLAPLLLLICLAPLAVVIVLLVVSLVATPAMLNMVSRQHFPQLEKRGSESLWAGGYHSVRLTLWAVAFLLLSMPLWLIPPLVLIVPPLIGGWLTYRLMSYDVLADHASLPERQLLMREHRMTLLGMGMLTGYLGAVPSLVWVSGALAVVLAPVLIPLALWLYTLVFAFSSLWFAHYALAALAALRLQTDAPAVLPKLSPP